MTDSNFTPGLDENPNENNIDSYHEAVNTGYNAGKFALSQEEIDKKIDERFEKFYRRVYPGFTLSSGTDTMAHGRAELCLTTETSQGIHFYEQGNCKIGSRNSIELRTGDQATGKDVAVTISAEHGHIVIEAPGGNLVLRGNNVLIESTEADGQVTMKSKKNLKIDAPNMLVESNYLTMAATSDALLYGGSDLTLWCEGNPVETGTGQDPILAAGLVTTILSMWKNAKTLFLSGVGDG